MMHLLMFHRTEYRSFYSLFSSEDRISIYLHFFLIQETGSNEVATEMWANMRLF